MNWTIRMDRWDRQHSPPLRAQQRGTGRAASTPCLQHKHSERKRMIKGGPLTRAAG